MFSVCDQTTVANSGWWSDYNKFFLVALVPSLRESGKTIMLLPVAYGIRE